MHAITTELEWLRSEPGWKRRVGAFAVREQQELAQHRRSQLGNAWLFEHVGEALAVLSEEH